MQKYLMAAVILVIVVFTYIIMAATQPVISELAATANASINGTSFASSSAVVNAYPIWQWIIPAFVGVVLLVITLRQPDKPV